MTKKPCVSCRTFVQSFFVTIRDLHPIIRSSQSWIFPAVSLFPKPIHPSSTLLRCPNKTTRKTTEKANMCITYRFYHLCGHIHRTSTLPRTYILNPVALSLIPEDKISSTQASDNPKADCTITAEEIRLFPTLCTKCEQAGVISEWLSQTPGGRFEVIRAWNRAHRRQKEGLEGEIEELERFDDEDEVCGSETVVESDVTAVDEEDDAFPKVPSPAPRSKAQGPDMVSLREKIAALTSRIQSGLRNPALQSRRGTRDVQVDTCETAGSFLRT